MVPMAVDAGGSAPAGDLISSAAALIVTVGRVVVATSRRYAE
jgi:hypothetical protein